VPNFVPMTLLESIEKQLSSHLRGSQVFIKEKLIEVIKEHNIVFANDVMIDNDEQGEHLILRFDDQIVCFELVWKQYGPRFTLIELRLA
jgi:hypothetical protein